MNNVQLVPNPDETPEKIPFFDRINKKQALIFAGLLTATAAIAYYTMTREDEVTLEVVEAVSENIVS